VALDGQLKLSCAAAQPAQAHGRTACSLTSNYTFSKSIDLASDAERIGFVGDLSGQIINSWDPKALRAVSDFDTNAPVQRELDSRVAVSVEGRIGREVGKAADAVIGGWQLSGLFRLTSGFPLNGLQWSAVANKLGTGGESNAGRGAGKARKRRSFPDGSVSIFPQGNRRL